MYRLKCLRLLQYSIEHLLYCTWLAKTILQCFKFTLFTLGGQRAKEPGIYCLCMRVIIPCPSRVWVQGGPRRRPGNESGYGGAPEEAWERVWVRGGGPGGGLGTSLGTGLTEYRSNRMQKQEHSIKCSNYATKEKLYTLDLVSPCRVEESGKIIPQHSSILHDIRGTFRQRLCTLDRATS